MNKFLAILKNKKILSFIAAGLAVLIVLISCSSIMISSKSEYDKYYNAAMAEKAEKKRLASLPLELKDISLNLVEGKRYYTDGVANPKKDDLEVIAHFTEKGQDFDRILESNDFEMTVAEGFAEKGGKIGVSYTYTPEKKEGEEADPTPVVKTAEIDVQLTKVVLESIFLEDKPYRIVYSDAMKFDVDGMSVLARYNNGHEAVIPASLLASEETGNLKAGSEAAVVSYTLDGVKKTVEVPVTVLPASEYTDGEVMSMKAEGEVVVKNGDDLTKVKPTIRATYVNGNRLILDKSAYDVKGNTETANFSNNCLLTCSLKKDKTIVCKAAATVRFSVEAEDTTLNSAVKKTVNEKSAVTNFAVKASLTFNINSKSLAKGKFTVSVANTSDTSVNLGRVLSMTVNGEFYPVSKLLATPENEDSYAEYQLPSVVLYSGDNEVQLKVVGGAKIAIDSFAYETKYEGAFYSSMGEYTEYNDDLSKLEVTAVSNWDSEQKPYMHGLCSDDTYVYAACTSWSADLRAILVKKYDPATSQLIAYSKNTPVESKEAFAGITYIDGKIIVFMANGTKYYTDAATLQDDWKEYTGFDIGTFKGAKIQDATYVAKRQAFVFRTGDNKISIVSKDGTPIKEFSLTRSGSPMRISVVNDYIFALYSSNGHYQPIVDQYNFEGKLLKQFEIVYDVSTVLGSVVTNTKNTNVQGIVAVNDSLYFSVLKFSTDNGGDQTKIIKVDYPEITDELEVNLSFGEYAAACERASATPAMTINNVTGTDWNKINGYSMGGVSDGEFYYLATNNGGNALSYVYKVNPETKEIVAKSSTITTGTAESGDNARLFIKDGVLYLVPAQQIPNKIFGLKLSEFNSNGVKFTEYPLPLKGVEAAKDITYSSEVDKYAAIVDSNLEIYSSDGTKQGDSVALWYSHMKASSVTNDDRFIYVSYCVNSQTETPIDVFDWTGKKITTFKVTGINLGNNASGDPFGYNIQAIFFHNGKLMASVCGWEGGTQFYHLFGVTLSMSALR